MPNAASKAGHQWVYSNEVDIEVTPLRGCKTAPKWWWRWPTAKPLGVAVVSPEQLICARLFSRDSSAKLDQSMLVHRLQVAQSGRELWYPQQCYRWVYGGDSDGLPGLVIDRFGEVVVVQISSMAMELRKEAIVAAVQKVAAQLHRAENDGKVRAQEGFARIREVVHGQLVDDCAALVENDTHFIVPVITGQKRAGSTITATTVRAKSFGEG